MRGIAAFGVVLSLFIGGTSGATAQAVTAGVEILLPPTSGAGVRPIGFGTVALGATVSRTIMTLSDSTAAGVGAFSFTGVNGNRRVQLTFDFPATLTHAASGNSMPITFSGNYGLHCFDRNSGVHSCTLFDPSPGGADPSVIVVTPPAPPRNGGFRVYLGGSVTAPASLSAGTYQGVISVTMTRL